MTALQNSKRTAIMSDTLLSRDSIITILESLEETRERVIKEGLGELPTDCSREDLAAYLD